MVYKQYKMSIELEAPISVQPNSIVSKRISSDDGHKTKEEKTLDFDDLLVQAGEFGRYQLYLFIATMPYYVYGVFVYFTQMFLTEVPSQHWCWIPELENLTATERRSLAIPPDDHARFGYSHCISYVANWSDVLRTGDKPNPSWETAKCQNGWEFDTSEIPYPTISTELGWVCDRRSYQASAQAIFFFGSVFGGFLIGWVADRFGRIPAIVASNVIGCVGGIASIFVHDFTEFAICRFFMGMSYDNTMMMAYLLVLEYIAPKYRTLIANLSFAVFYSLAAIALPWIALACGHWKITSVATSLPLILALSAPLLLLESPRWLLTKGRVDDAVNKVLHLGKVNRKDIPSKMIQKFKEDFSNKKNTEKGNMYEILKNPVLRKMFVLICVEYMCCVIVFDALVRSLGMLDFDFFVSFSVVSATEFPSILILAFVMDWVGRRWLICSMSAISFVFCILIAFVGSGTGAVVCAVVARFAINMSYNTAIQWGAELFPTSVRGSALSAIHILGYIATMVSPYIVYLEVYVTWLPMVLSGLIGFLSAVTALTLPETARKDMPQTFEDAEVLANSQRFFELPTFAKKEIKGHEGQDNCSFEP